MSSNSSMPGDSVPQITTTKFPQANGGNIQINSVIPPVPNVHIGNIQYSTPIGNNATFEVGAARLTPVLHPTYGQTQYGAGLTFRF